MRILMRIFLEDRKGFVRASVIHEQDLIVVHVILHRIADGGEQIDDIFFLVVNGNHYG